MKEGSRRAFQYTESLGISVVVIYNLHIAYKENVFFYKLFNGEIRCRLRIYKKTCTVEIWVALRTYSTKEKTYLPLMNGFYQGVTHEK